MTHAVRRMGWPMHEKSALVARQRTTQKKKKKKKKKNQLKSKY